ncbi:50S ribosomal protein L7/L12 [Anaerolineales bacterium HSG25]|nr:50S ribosomal protein L7/L12 [Anaerolineales bacterium HSG25]
MMADLEKIVEELSQLTVLEASELTKLLEEKWGVSAAAPAMMSAMPGVAAGGGEAEEEEEKTEFDVTLKDVGAKKIQVIKAVRSLRSDLGLKEAKALVDGTPAKILEAVTKEMAEEAKAKLEGEGASADIS